ncbi:hypothetical protein DPMN_149686 [Dreissena polymorpha]|uniref:SUEL-type lectin domain-containing protein n=1 Tax=Dreissena polymorpha TaxID=45954 RepID=A0A9D4FBT5_DREPO|nr:hypothetical protein DPMN_149686 [Dreissena polymorpha]
MKTVVKTCVFRRSKKQLCEAIGILRGVNMAPYLNCVFVAVACCVYTALGSIILCEWQSAYLACPAGEVLDVTSGVFGRTRGNSICPSHNVENQTCTSPTSTGIVKGLCDGKPTCQLSASIYIYGDPCPATFKYLEVDHDCVK